MADNLVVMFNKLAISGMVWLTAVSTLVARTPHLSCRCPDGSIKLFCFGFLASVSQKNPNHKSCCGTEHRSCCGQKEVAAHVPMQTDGPAFTGFCCDKALVQAEAAVVEGVPLLVDAGLNISLDSLTNLPANDGFAHREWSYHSGSPPTDLLLAYQHFLI